MFRSTLIVAVTALSTAVRAQLSNGLNYSTSGPLEIDVTQIDLPTRQAWCRAQTNSCPQICGGRAQPNTCDSATLNYTCTCTDGSMPNITDYDQTIPAFVCATWKGNCVANSQQNLAVQTDCLSVQCGMKNASSGESTATTSSAESSTSTPSSTSSGAGAGGASATSATPSASATESSAAMALNIAAQYGTGIMGAGLLAIFGLAL